MSVSPVRPAFPSWPDVNRHLRDAVASLTEEQLAFAASPERWPLWASIGHLACQRVFWLCDFAGAPGAAASPFPDAGWNCPGDDDLERVWSARELADALDATFGMVEWCLDTWTLKDLAEVISHPDRVHTRGFALQRVFAHDVSHIAEMNEILALAGLPQIDLWG